MKRFLLFLLCTLIFGVSSFAQLLYPVQGRYNKLGGQGMAIWGDEAYLFCDTGFCRIYNLKTSTVTGEFWLASKGEHTHVNSAQFGAEIPEGGDKPALYIGECFGGHRCFVEKVVDTTSVLVQTISVVEDGERVAILTWGVDAKNGFLYGVSRGGKAIDEEGNKPNTIHKFRLPRLDEGAEVILTEKDLLDRFTVYFPNILQGAEAKGRYLYILTGLQQSLNTRLDACRAVKVIDLKKQELKKDIDLTYVTVNEPEDIDFYKNKTLLFCNGEGGIHKIRLK